MRVSLVLKLLLCLAPLSAQRVINHEIPVTGTITLAQNTIIPRVNPGYTVWLPSTGNPRGLIVFTNARRDTVHTGFLIDYALQHQLAVFHGSTDNSVEFFFEDEKMKEMEGYIHDALSQFQIPDSNLLFCGMSLEGTRALKLAMFSQSEKSIYNLKPRAIAICDAPIDMVRFHKAAKRSSVIRFHPISASEGEWVSSYLESNLGGTPQDALPAYELYSPFCHVADGGMHLSVFMDIALRAYTEPDVNWWMETRRNDYYSMNAIDMAAFVNALNLLGNTRAQLITTTNKGYREDGTRHPHSWSIVDEKELVDWFLALLH